MDLKITLFRSNQALLDNKPCFKETIPDVSADFGYGNLILALKSVLAYVNKANNIPDILREYKIVCVPII